MWDLSNVTFQNDALRTEFRDACAEQYGWTGADDPRGGTKAAFSAWVIKRIVRDIVKGYRNQLDDAGKEARTGEPDTN